MTRLAAILLALLAAMPARAAETAVFSHFSYRGAQPAHAAIPLKAGEYRNPILEGSYSDPSIVRVGRDYYLATSSFTLFPGSPILRSCDLVHWRQIGSAISRPGQLDFRGRDTWLGNYANDLKHHDGVFYLMSACQGCGGAFLMTARDASGPWSDPVFLPLEGIDTAIFFDDDGRAYTLISGPPPGGAKWDGHRAIWLQELDLKTLKLIGERTVLVDGGDDPSGKPFWLEGPHLLKHDGRYVLIAAQGGTKEAHSEVAFRSETLRGRYLPSPHNPILSQNGLDPGRRFPVTQVGHADVVTTQAGEDWAVFLGSRPWSADTLAYDTGRETFLARLLWTEGWPTILPAGSPVPLTARRPALPDAPTGEAHAGDFAFADSFASPKLKPAWASLGAPVAPWWRAGGGALRLEARAEPLGGKGQPSLLMIRQQHMTFTAEVTVDAAPREPGARAGLAAYQGRRRSLAIAVARLPGGGREVRLDRVGATADPEDGVRVARAPLPARGAVRLRIAARGRDHRFAYAVGRGAWRALGGVQDGAPLSTRGSGGFTGTMLGPFATTPGG